MSALLVAHGSRDPRFAATARRVRDAVAASLPDVPVTLAYLDLDEPSVPDALTGLTGDVAVVPLLLGDAFHNRVDLPGLLVDAARPDLSTVHTPVLADPALTTALADRLAEAGVTPDDGVLMCAVGSSDADADAVTVRRAGDLAGVLARRGLDVPVQVAFATRSDSVRSAEARLRVDGARRVVVAPWFLSAGTLTDRVERILDEADAHGDRPWAMAGPLGTHPAVIDVVRRRVVAALDRRTAGVPTTH
ncbi:sirohydrochlorin chelatase [Williamsia sp. SKLECPSW1]